MTSPYDPEDPSLRAAVSEILADHVPKIRAKARADDADELEAAGHDAAAYYLREVPGE